MEYKAVAVGREDEGDVEDYGVIKALLHAVADAVIIVLGFNKVDGDVWFVVEDAVVPLLINLRNVIAWNSVF